jgi:RNA polymerase sigma-70 factor (ECF subfamily)
MSHYTDKELLQLYFQGDNKNYAFNLIVRAYQEKLYWHIRRLVIDHEDANDVVQNVFIKAWKNLENFRGESELYTWLYRIATNESLTFLEQKKKRIFVDVEEFGKHLEADSVGFEGDKIQLKLQKAIALLPEKQRAVFLLKYYEEMTYEDMAKVLNTSAGALKASFHHAVKKIEKYLQSN